MGKLNIVSGNLFDYLDNKDLIVNSANQYMIYGSGVCGAIYKMADKDLLEKYCKEHFKDNMKVNEIRFTPGFNIGIDILHISLTFLSTSFQSLKGTNWFENKQLSFIIVNCYWVYYRARRGEWC